MPAPVLSKRSMHGNLPQYYLSHLIKSALSDRDNRSKIIVCVLNNASVRHRRSDDVLKVENDRENEMENIPIGPGYWQ